MIKLLTEHHLEFLSLKGGCTCSSESTHVKMPHCWKSHVTAHLSNEKVLSTDEQEKNKSFVRSCDSKIPPISSLGKPRDATLSHPHFLHGF